MVTVNPANCSLLSPLYFSPVLKSESQKMQYDAEIADALQAEAVFTNAAAKKPIVATYGCGPCVAVGGFEPANKMAFLVHFQLAEEVRACGGEISGEILKLISKKMRDPIQLHLRGGELNCPESEETIKAIRQWMYLRNDLPMQIASIDLFPSDPLVSKSLLIDSRTGHVSEYDLSANPKVRVPTDGDESHALQSATEPDIVIAYTPAGK